MTSCSSNSINNKIINNFDFSEETNIDEYILKLETYSKEKSYPNIDN